MIKYLYPSNSQYETLLCGQFVEHRLDVTCKLNASMLARQFAKVIRDAQDMQPDLNIGFVGVRGTGKSFLSGQMLFANAGEITINYRGKKGEFQGVSSKLGDIGRFDTWAQPVSELSDVLKKYQDTRSCSKSLLVVEHGQYNQTIPYDVMLTLQYYPANDELPAARTLDIRLRPQIAQTQSFNKFQRKSNALTLG